MKWQCVRILQYASYFNYGKERFWLEYSQGALPHLPLSTTKMDEDQALQSQKLMMERLLPCYKHQSKLFSNIFRMDISSIDD